MAKVRFGEDINIVHGVSPIDIVATDVDSAYLKLDNAHWVTFIVALGTITGDTMNITIEASTTNASASAITVGGWYRFKTAIGADSWEGAAATTFDSSGVTVTASDDDKILLIDYDPTENPDYNYVRLALVTAGSMSACEVAVVYAVETRYKQEYQPTTT